MPETNKTYTVYKWTNRKNGRCYVGMTDKPSRRRQQHISGHSPDCLLYKAIQKHGLEAFDYEELSEDLDEPAAFKVEEHYIEKTKAYTHGYNRTKGGRIARPGYGEEHHNSKITEETAVAAIMDPCSEIRAARKYKIHRSKVYQLRRGIIWPHLDRSKAPQYENDKNKLTKKDARDIFLDPRSQPIIAKQYGIDPSSVSNIKRRCRWNKTTEGLVRPERDKSIKKQIQGLGQHTGTYKVFRIINTANDKTYIGVSKNPYHQMHNLMHGTSTQPIRADVVKYGKEAFLRQIVDSTFILSEATKKKQKLIMRQNSLFPFGYNLSIGGQGSKGALWNGKQRSKINGSKNSRSKLTEEDVVAILKDPRKRKEIAEEYGVSGASISNIKNRKRWGHVPLPKGYVPLTKKRRTS